MIRGTVCTIGDRKYILPPMNVEVMEAHEQFIGRCLEGEMEQKNMIRDIVEVAQIMHETLKQNYPDIDLQVVKKGINFGNMQEFVTLLFKSSDFVESIPGE